MNKVSRVNILNSINKLFLILALVTFATTTAEVTYSYEDLIKLGIPLDILHSHNAYVEFIEFIPPIEPSGEDKPPPTNQQKPEEEKEDLDELLLKAYFAYHKKDYQKSKDLLSRAEKVAPNHPRVNAMQGSLYYKLGFTTLAKNKWEKSLKSNPDQKQVKYFLKKLDGGRKNAPK